MFGPAGSGKSSIAQSVAENLSTEGRLAASFFFSRKKLDRSTTGHLIPSLAYQLAHSVPSMKAGILKAVNDDVSLLDKIYQDQLTGLILKPAAASGHERQDAPNVIILDALDECQDERIVAELILLLTQLPFLIFITSRQAPHLQRAAKLPDVRNVMRSLQLTEYDASDDIRLFLKRRLSESSDGPDTWPSDDDIDQLVSKSASAFIFASTVVEFVDGKDGSPRDRLRIMLGVDTGAGGNASSALDLLYQEIFSGLPGVRVALSLMGIIVHLFNPLPVRDLEVLLAGKFGHPRSALQGLRAVLLIPESDGEPFLTYHLSLPEFLTDRQRSAEHFVDPALCHAQIARLCLELMGRELRRDICGIVDASKFNSEVEDLPDRCRAAIGPGVGYACVQWASHLTKAPPGDAALAECVLTFCKHSLLHWLEALSLLGRFEATISILQKASEWAEVSG